MIYQSPQNPNVHLTVKDRKWPSYPTKQLWNRGFIQGRVLDFGCGLGADIGFLRENKIDAVGYDPHYAPEYPVGKFDTILCHYVLNVLLVEEQAHALMAISELLKPTGRAYFTVRRDIKQSGFRTHTEHGRKVYQCNVALPYKSILSAEHCEVYEYEHFNKAVSQQTGEAKIIFTEQTGLVRVVPIELVYEIIGTIISFAKLEVAKVEDASSEVKAEDTN